MSIDDFFLRLIAALERADVPYMVTGSYASSAHGEPRASNDIDIVIAPTPKQLHALMQQFPSDRYYADEEDAFDMFKQKLQFNIIDFATFWKADLIFRKDRKFSDTEFLRRSRHLIAGREVYLTTAEDILIAKLEWAKLGESARQIEDAAGVIRRQGPALDRQYVEHWVRELELLPQWHAALSKAG